MLPPISDRDPAAGGRPRCRRPTRLPEGGAVTMGCMLHDRARIHVQAGAGGDGCTSFRREAPVRRGRPDGGDGGYGGHVVLVCEDSLRDLQEFRRKTHYSAGRGGHGEGSQRHGAAGDALFIRVPPGTQVTGLEGEDGDLGGRRWELLAAGQRATVARGGAGGKGNKRFANPNSGRATG